MRDAARLAAVLEVLTECEASWQTAKSAPSDILLHRYLKSRRYIGSKDRGAIAELVYYIIRNRAALLWWCEKYGLLGARPLLIAALCLKRPPSPSSRRKEESGEAADDKVMSVSDLYHVFTGEKFAPARMTQNENDFARTITGKKLLHDDMPDHVRYNYPEWMEKDLRSALGKSWKEEMLALSGEAPVDLRTNTLLTTRDDLLAALRQEKYTAEPTPHSPLCVRLRTRAPVFTSAAFKRGWFEIQDEGSQLVSLLLDAKPGEKVIDFCAGAGGKTLALAAQMKNKGRILAWDTSKKRLDQMPERLARAKVDNVQRHVIASESDAFIKRHKDSADAVLVDAPCSGSGTWRRNPDLKWRMGEKELHELLALQQRILASAARLVKKNGRLLYVTCSLLESENENQIETFLNAHPKFKVVTAAKIWDNKSQQAKKTGGSLRLTPHQDGTDGFFASLLQRDSQEH